MRQHRFTIADDDADALFLLNRMIEQMYPQSSISMFSNAEDALAHIRDTGTDMLITNHGMGELTGTDLIRTLRAQKVEIPIIMVSGNQVNAIVAPGVSAGIGGGSATLVVPVAPPLLPTLPWSMRTPGFSLCPARAPVKQPCSITMPPRRLHDQFV